jgi:hypothetical protein
MFANADHGSGGSYDDVGDDDDGIDDDDGDDDDDVDDVHDDDADDDAAGHSLFLPVQCHLFFNYSNN